MAVMESKYEAFLAGVVVGMLGIAFIFGLIGVGEHDSMTNKAIAECEATLARNLKCEAVYEARVVEGD